MHETLLAEKAHVVTVYLAEDYLSDEEIWGDDWNDAPACCNAGPPYLKEGIYKKEVYLGEKW